jgi:hypothetical protein
MLQLSLASKLGFYPLTKAVYLLDYALCMYWKQFEMLLLGLALKLGLHPVAIAHPNR